MKVKVTFDYNKEQYRGTLKQIMKVRGLRTISIANYINWYNKNSLFPHDESHVHSLKLDIQDGYINAYGWKGKKCGDKIEDLSTDEYRKALMIVNEMLNNEDVIPYNERRNIFVKVCR